MIYFGFYHSVKEYFPAYEVRWTYYFPSQTRALKLKEPLWLSQVLSAAVENAFESKRLKVKWEISFDRIKNRPDQMTDHQNVVLVYINLNLFPFAGSDNGIFPQSWHWFCVRNDCLNCKHSNGRGEVQNSRSTTSSWTNQIQIDMSFNGADSTWRRFRCVVQRLSAKSYETRTGWSNHALGLRIRVRVSSGTIFINGIQSDSFIVEVKRSTYGTHNKFDLYFVNHVLNDTDLSRFTILFSAIQTKYLFAWFLEK